jgi:5-bromo-4-chloroindolyl phosphate hydrolysis protein
MKKIYTFTGIILIIISVIVIIAITNERNTQQHAWNESYDYCSRCTPNETDEIATDYESLTEEERIEIAREKMKRLEELSEREVGWSQFTPENPVTVPKPVKYDK